MDSKGIAFVTGASGRIGSRLCALLLNEGYTVRALVKEKSLANLLPAGVIPFLGDLGDFEVLEEASKGASFVFHTAGIVGESGKKITELNNVNVQGTKNVVDACEEAHCTRLIFTSSIDVYGRSRKEVITEETPPKPSDKYGYSKLLAEKAIIGSDLDYTIFRIATVYGPGFEQSFFKVFEAIIEGKIMIIGSGENHLSLIHIYDVLNAFLLTIRNHKSTKQIYNLSDGVAYTQKGLIDMAADLLNAKRPEKHISEFLVKLLAKRENLDSDELRFLTSNRVVSIEKIKTDLGFVPQISMDTAGAELVNMFIKRRVFS